MKQAREAPNPVVTSVDPGGESPFQDQIESKKQHSTNQCLKFQAGYLYFRIGDIYEISNIDNFEKPKVLGLEDGPPGATKLCSID